MVLTKKINATERRIKRIEPIKNVKEISNKMVIGKIKIWDKNWPKNL